MKEKIVAISFILVLFIFMILGAFMKDEEVSFTERRKLTTIPEFRIENIFSESDSYFKKMDNYLVDHFPFRDSFRKLKGAMQTKVFLKKENDGIFVKDDVIYQIDNKIDEKSVKHLTNIIKYVDETYLNHQNIYFAMIPDKNYYLKDSSIPKMDYEKMKKMLKEGLPDNYKFIDLANELELSSYYRTDIHWKQEKLEKVVLKLRDEMNLESYPFPKEKESYKPFYGAYYGRIASNISADTLYYLKSYNINNAKVFNYEKQIKEEVYNKNNLKNVDSYDVFLSGATPLLVIDNNINSNGKELIVFRDSFASSLVPLLIPNYSKITMIDLRYLSSKLLSDIKYIDFSKSNTDILFLYSIPVINNSYTLK